MRAALVLALWLSTGGLAWAEACKLNHSGAPDVSVTIPGVARGPATAQEIVSQTAIAVMRAHAPLSPKYANLPRAFVYFVWRGVRHGTIASVLDGVMPRPGEAVTLTSRRRDPDVPCAFIPWTITKGTPAKPSV